MIKIENQTIFARCVANALVTIDNNRAINTGEKLRAINAVGKAVNRIETDGCFMDYDADADRLVIWSQTSNLVYELRPGRPCGCVADQHGLICWHKAAKRLIELYNAAMMAALCSEYVSGCSIGAKTPKNAVVDNLQPHEMPYLQPADTRQMKAVGGCRI